VSSEHSAVRSWKGDIPVARIVFDRAGEPCNADFPVGPANPPGTAAALARAGWKTGVTGRQECRLSENRIRGSQSLLTSATTIGNQT
jgi:hypothetical protein